jgi:hypothetical protein
LYPTFDDEGGSDPKRGIIIGYDDTPVGIFAHATDVTNLHPDGNVTREMIRDAMGFDIDIDPYDPPSSLPSGGEKRVRLQGDLRVERTADMDQYIDLYEHRLREEYYIEPLRGIFADINLPSAFLSSESMRSITQSVFALDIIEPGLTSDGDIRLREQTGDARAVILALAELMVELSVPPVESVEDYGDIPALLTKTEISLRQGQITRTSLTQAKRTLRDRCQIAIKNELETNHEFEARKQQIRDAKAEANVALDTEPQANLPIDNHLIFIKDGFVPELDTEPIPVAIPANSTITLEHAEHNSITMDVPPGVYTFSLLPRGLQPPSERPGWNT